MRRKPDLLSIEIPELSQKVSGLLQIPKKAKALLVLAHGAGAGMRHPTMSALVEALEERGVATLRYQFPYMERGLRRPDSPRIAMAAVVAAVKAGEASAPKLPLFAGGKSFGSRMTTQSAANEKIPSVRGLVCFGFPLHPSKQPGIDRAAHLADVRIPTLLVQGTRDDLAELTLVEKVVSEHSHYLELHVVEGADHSFAVLKRSGRTNEEALAEVADVASAFCLRAIRS